jgi:glycosyltransferase involved in cell wall biosynthesis
LGYLLKKIFFPKIKLIFHEHGRIFQTRKTYPTLLKLIQGQVDRFIAVSEATKSKLVDKASVKPQNIRTLYNFIDLDAFNNAAHPKSKDEIRSRYGISEFAFVVGFAGRIVPSKGWKEFISSIPLLIEQNQTIKFVIAGDGPDKRAMLAMIAALEVDQHVHFLGYQPNMQEFYAMLDCFVVASHRESMGLTVVEAKAMGVPVVSSDVPALNALTQNGEDGLLFDVHDVEDLVAKVLMIFSDTELREKLINKGLKKASLFDLPSYIDSLNQIYTEIQS